MGLPAACRSCIAVASGRGSSKTLAAAAAAAALTSSPPPAATPTKSHFLPTRRHSTTAAAAATEHPQMAPADPATNDPTPPPPPPPATSPWVILGSIPRVVQGGRGEAAADVSLALAAPPRVSRLSVSSRVFPDRPTPQNFPFLLAADASSGLLLLSAILAAPPTRVESADGKSLCHRDSDARYFVLDAAAGSALRLPYPGGSPDAPIEHPALVGLLPCPGGGGRYVVSELLPIIGSDHADLRCYHSDAGEWVNKSLRYPLPARHLAPICTLALHGRLWWADYSWGIISANPFADHPVLGFVPLPSDCVLRDREAWGALDIFRYVGVSAGNLRFVDTYRRGGEPNKVTVWTLPDPYATKWTLEHEAAFADIWADDSYEATGLPKEVPVLALIHPHNPAVVYFFLEGHLFGVDVSARKVVECDRYHLVAPPRDYPIANRFIRAWELPQPVSSDLGNWSTDIGSSEPTEAPPSQPGDYHLVGNTRLSRNAFPDPGSLDWMS